MFTYVILLFGIWNPDLLFDVTDMATGEIASIYLSYYMYLFKITIPQRWPSILKLCYIMMVCIKWPACHKHVTIMSQSHNSDNLVTYSRYDGLRMTETTGSNDGMKCQQQIKLMVGQLTFK